MKSFNESLNPLSPQELLALLKTQDHDEVVQGREGHVINKRDLDQLLDRSDLYDVWLNKQEAEQGKGKFIKGTFSFYYVFFTVNSCQVVKNC